MDEGIGGIRSKEYISTHKVPYDTQGKTMNNMRVIYFIIFFLVVVFLLSIGN